jgi:hypothetical protein
MREQARVRSAVSLLAAAAGIAAGTYLLFAGATWCRYGRVPRERTDQRDEWLDRFMPIYDVVERHDVRVAAPAEVTLAVACEQDLFDLPLVRLIFRTRELVLGAHVRKEAQPRGLIEAVRMLGWGQLAAVAGREIVMGAVTKPWQPDVIFRALPPDEFEAFAEPGFVKIAWTLRADPIDHSTSMFRTETRAVATDAVARGRFRLYWAFVSPGVALIRRLSLRPLKRDAERRATLRRLVVSV